MFMAFYLVGGLLAAGMVISEIFPLIKEDLSNAIGFGDKSKTFSFHLLQSAFFILIAFVLSWVAVGYVYMKRKHRA
jgi:hypothetical protein